MQGKEVKGESKKASRNVGDKAKKLGHDVEDKAKDAAGWVQHKSHDVLDSGRHAAEVSHPCAEAKSLKQCCTRFAKRARLVGGAVLGCRGRWKTCWRDIYFYILYTVWLNV